MNCIKTVLLVFICVASIFAADSWQSLSKPLPIRSAVSYQDGVLLATDGGIRYRTPSADRIYTSKDGLETTVFYSLVSSDGNVYAVSEYGMVASLAKGASRWKVLNRSFINNRVRAVPDMAVTAGNYLVIGFENRIAFFNISRQSSILTIDRIGKISLRDEIPQKIWINGDSLYVALGGNRYARKMDWTNLEKDIHLVNPDSWVKAGIYKEVLSSSGVVLNGKTLKDSILYKEDKVRIRWSISRSSSSGYLVGPDVILYYDGSTYENLTFSMMLHVGEVYEMRPLPSGGVMMATYNGLFASHDGDGWSEDTPLIDDGRSNILDAEGSRMKVMSLTSDGYVLYHIWGEGFLLYSNYGKKLKRKFSAADNSLCMDKYLDNYTVSIATTVAPDSLGFLTTTASSDGYSLIYISLDGKMSCLSHVGKSPFAGPIAAQAVEDGNLWDVYVGFRDAANAATDGGFERLTVVPPSKNSGRLALKSKVSCGGLDDSAPVDMALDKKSKTLWIVSNNILGYYEIGGDTIRQPSSTKGLRGAEYSSVEVDVHGNVWLGTVNQGAYRLSRVKQSNDTLAVDHFVEKDGLLKDKISDIAIDPVLGMAWFSHENGVTIYRRNDLRNAEAMMTDSAGADVKVYPNPFRTKLYSHVTIDNIEEGVPVSIFNRGGSLIRYFSGPDVLGGRVDWDGRDKNGQLVVPGVYYYVVKGLSKVKKGKIIIIH